MTEYIYQTELANGIPGLPKISKYAQASARKKGLVSIKIGRHIVYKKSDIEKYLQKLQSSNIRPAKTTRG